jgi:hypothetical protein
MPRLTMETAHALGRQEAARRLKEKFNAVRDAHRGQVSDLDEQWNDHTFSFAFQAVGMRIAGTVTVEDSAVKLAAELPLAAMMFRGMIEARVQAELGGLLG